MFPLLEVQISFPAVLEMHSALDNTFPDVSSDSWKYEELQSGIILSIFGSIYLCEQVVSSVHGIRNTADQIEQLRFEACLKFRTTSYFPNIENPWKEVQDFNNESTMPSDLIGSLFLCKNVFIQFQITKLTDFEEAFLPSLLMRNFVISSTVVELQTSRW